MNDFVRNIHSAYEAHTDFSSLCKVYQERPNGEYVVKKEIREFMASLENRHAQLAESSEESKKFLKKVLDLIKRMLNPVVQDRVDISRVVDTLSGALKRAVVSASEATTHYVIPASDETILGGPQLNQISLLHWSEASKEWESSNLEVLENEAGFMRLHRWAHGQVPNNINFRRSDVKIIPLYAFWDPMNAYDSRTWINFLFLSANRRSEVSDAKFSFDGNSGLEEARIVQSKLTSQNIVGSFALGNVGLSKPVSVSSAIKGFFRKMTPTEKSFPAQGNQKFMVFGSATIQIWVEQEDEVVAKLLRRQSLASQATATSRAVRVFDGDQQKVRPCRVAIYLHEQRFVCTIKIDMNWVLEESAADNKVLLFKPHPLSRDRPFYASWIRPTQEELDDDCPAGIPLSPKVLSYYEDLDSFEAEEFSLTFLSNGDREDFKWKFWEVKKAWDIARQKLENTIAVNRMPEKEPRQPDGVGLLPVPRTKVPLTTQRSRPASFQSSSSGSMTRSRHDSTMEDTTATRLDPTRLMVPEYPSFNRRSMGGTWR